jgi:alpha/beta superfamily hydrolase
MPEVIFNGTEGRLEGRYHHSKQASAPIALALHPHPLHGGTMNNRVVFSLFHAFQQRGFSVLRFNFRGVGRSQGRFDNGLGELNDAASALDATGTRLWRTASIALHMSPRRCFASRTNAAQRPNWDLQFARGGQL